jgi:hypothetical protein
MRRARESRADGFDKLESILLLSPLSGVLRDISIESDGQPGFERQGVVHVLRCDAESTNGCIVDGAQNVFGFDDAQVAQNRCAK